MLSEEKRMKGYQGLFNKAMIWIFWAAIFTFGGIAFQIGFFSLGSPGWWIATFLSLAAGVACTLFAFHWIDKSEKVESIPKDALFAAKTASHRVSWALSLVGGAVVFQLAGVLIGYLNIATLGLAFLAIIMFGATHQALASSEEVQLAS